MTSVYILVGLRRTLTPNHHSFNLAEYINGHWPLLRRLSELRTTLSYPGLCNDGSMAKRSTRMARRDNYEGTFQRIEDSLRPSSGKNPAGAALERDGKTGKAKAKEARKKARSAKRT
jgi:hypothetical protein